MPVLVVCGMQARRGSGCVTGAAPPRRHSLSARNFPRRSLALNSLPPGEEGTVGDLRFASSLSELASYKEKHGHASPPLGTPLGRWVITQRRLRREGRMDGEKEAQLERLGFTCEHPFDAVDADDWDDMRERLAEFQAKNGHANVKKKYDADPALGFWCNEQRVAFRERRLDEHQIDSLHSLGFDFDPPKRCGSAFMINLRELTAFRDENGHLDVEPGTPLAAWCDAQRKAHLKGQLSEKRVDYLRGIGFELPDP